MCTNLWGSNSYFIKREPGHKRGKVWSPRHSEAVRSDSDQGLPVFSVAPLYHWPPLVGVKWNEVSDVSRDAWRCIEVTKPYFLLSPPCRNVLSGFYAIDRKIQLPSKVLARANVCEQDTKKFPMHTVPCRKSGSIYYVPAVWGAQSLSLWKAPNQVRGTFLLLGRQWWVMGTD